MSEKPTVGHILIPGGMKPQPETHELETADVFARTGKDVEFIPPRRMRGSKMPDIKMDGVLWEMKSPTGSGKKTIQDQIKRAMRQSKNIILDGRRTKLTDEYIVKELQKQVALSRSIKRLIFISKTDTIIDIQR